jgi:glycerophosphoryl diester phosphodiesterase
MKREINSGFISGIARKAGRRGLMLLLMATAYSCEHTARLTGTEMPDHFFDKEGHRGCRGLMPENTIPAMIRALELGVTTLEMDIAITADKQVLISHDPFFNSEITTKPDGGFIEEKDERNYRIYGMTYRQTLQYDVGLKFYPDFPRQKKIPVHKPLLADLVDSVRIYAAKNNKPFPYLNIETKTRPETDGIFHPGPVEFVDLLMAVIRDKKIEDKVIIQSFDIRTLQYLHRKYPAIMTSLLVEKQDDNLHRQFKRLGFIPTVYSPAYKLVNTKLINQCHRQHVRVVPWTVDERAEIEKLIRIGVDGIITDYPDLLSGMKVD